MSARYLKLVITTVNDDVLEIVVRDISSIGKLEVYSKLLIVRLSVFLRVCVEMMVVVLFISALEIVAIW